MISHERVDRLLGQLGLPPALARLAADRINARLVAEFDVVVCATPTIVTAMRRPPPGP